MSHPSMEKSNNSGILPKPSLSKGKSTSPSPRQTLQGGVRPSPLVTHSRSPTPTSKPSPHVSGNPSTSRLSTPASQTRPEVRDSESDDDAPLVFRAKAKPVPSLKVQSKDHSKNGVTSSRVDTDTVRKVVETVRKASGNACHQSSEHLGDNSEDDRPLAVRVPAKRPPEVLAQDRRTGADDSDGDDEDDEKPLVLKRRANGPGPAKIAKSHATPQREDGSSKKRLLADSDDDDDDKPLAWRRGSDGPTKSQVVQKEDSSSKKRPPDNNKKGDTGVKKLKLSGSVPKSSGSSLGQLSKPQINASKPGMATTTPKTLTSSTKPSSLSTIPPTSATKSYPAPSKPSTQPVKPPATTAKPLAAPAKPFTDPAKPMATPAKPSTAPTKLSSEPSKPVTASPKFSATTTKSSVKVEVDEDEDDVPLAQRISGPKVVKKTDERIPLAERIAASKASKKAIVIKKTLTTSVAAKKLVEAKKAKLKQQQKLMSGKRVQGDKNAPGAGGGKKWTTLEHNGVIFPPPYSPHGVKMLYEKKPVTLTPEQEEVATMFAVMRDTDYATKPKFLSNFWNDWKKILGPNHVIKNLEGCDFTPIYNWALAEKEKKKQLPAEEKKRIKEEKAKQEDKYMWALVDGIKEKVGNFRVEPPGLFRGRGEHPKMGKLKRRIFPEDIVINIAEDAPIPECPMPGHRWKEIRHDDTVTWLAYWNDPINTKEFKYVFLAASSSLKGQSDREKYEKARTLKDYIEDIRKTYTRNFTSIDMTQRQIAVATYLIDRLALRAGNEKDDDEADTVGCCSLKVEHVTLVPPKSLQFDFLGKDSIRYFNTVEVVEPVYKAIGDFKKSKKPGQDLFDKLDTNKLNAHLKNIMPHLTAKVFRTYNASITLDRLLVDTDGQIVAEKIASYQKANKEVAILCNHQRSVSKTHGAQMERLEGKMAELEDLLKELQVDLDRAKRGKPPLKDADGKPKRNQNPEALRKKIMQTEQKIEKMRLDMQIKDDLKTVALGTSKINYMDPRITVAWCKRHEVPIEKVFNKSLLAKFAWAMDVDMEYRF